MARLSLEVYLVLFCGIVGSQSFPTDDIALPEGYGSCDGYPPELQDPQVSCCGPNPTIDPVGTMAPVVLPTVSGPIYNLPCPQLPLPVVTSTRCQCTKTVVKPQLFQRTITAQKDQRFLKQSYVPVTETITFVARPSCGSSPTGSSSGSNSGSGYSTSTGSAQVSTSSNSATSSGCGSCAPSPSTSSCDSPVTTNSQCGSTSNGVESICYG